MRDSLTDLYPATVPATAKHVGEVRSRWDWTEPSVWTERMLTALEHGVKGGSWFSLIDKVYATANLDAAFTKVAANGGAAGVDHVTRRNSTISGKRTWANFSNNCEPVATGRRQCVASGFPNREAGSNVRWGFRRSVTARFRRRSAT